MKEFKFLCLFTSVLISLLACKSEGGSGSSGIFGGGKAAVSGKVTNLPPDSQVFLDEILGKQVTILDTTKVGADGSFSLTVKDDSPRLGRVRLGRANLIVLLDGKEVKLNVDANNPNAYEVTGSPDNSTLASFIKTIQSNQASPDYLKNFVDTVKSPLVGYMAIHYLQMEEHYPVYEKFAARLTKELPSSPLTAEFAQRVNNAKQSMSVSSDGAAPEIKLATPAGKDLALSSLKGKVVLVDFWASWCMPCRRENPNVVKMYEKYKNKGFEVFSVSLDRSKEPWVKAIETDKLVWPSHVSDLQGWNSSAAGAWGVRSIPATFLLDKEGKIIGRNLRGPDLEKKLAEVLGEV